MGSQQTPSSLAAHTGPSTHAVYTRLALFTPVPHSFPTPAAPSAPGLPGPARGAPLRAHGAALPAQPQQRGAAGGCRTTGGETGRIRCAARSLSRREGTSTLQFYKCSSAAGAARNSLPCAAPLQKQTLLQQQDPAALAVLWLPGTSAALTKPAAGGAVLEPPLG